MEANTQKSPDQTGSAPDIAKREADPGSRKFKANSRYFTISIYAIGVIFVGVIIIKLFCPGVKPYKLPRKSLTS